MKKELSKSRTNQWVCDSCGKKIWGPKAGQVVGLKIHGYEHPVPGLFHDTEDCLPVTGAAWRIPLGEIMSPNGFKSRIIHMLEEDVITPGKTRELLLRLFPMNNLTTVMLGEIANHDKSLGTGTAIREPSSGVISLEIRAEKLRRQAARSNNGEQSGFVAVDMSAPWP